VKLLSTGFGDVGMGTIVEVHPMGQWLGVDIPLASKEFILLRPTIVKPRTEDLPLDPCQRGFSRLVEALWRTVLWRVANVMVPSGDPQVDASPFVRQECWVGLEVHSSNVQGVLVSSGRIMCLMPDDHFHYGRLGEDHVGVIVLDVFIGNTETIMSHETWPIAECSFLSGRSLQCTIDHFTALPIAEDPNAHFGGRSKEPY
jgi:hypothetical protein